jgi:NADPH2:quinone reductase
MFVSQVREFGGPDELRRTEVADPVAGDGEVLLAVEAAGVNRVDLLFRSGRYHRPTPLPAVPGVEGAGTVLAVGPGVDGIAVGDRVVGWGATGQPGFYAERAVLPAGHVLAVPDGVDAASAAALPTAWLSAWYCLRHLGGIGAGQTALITAAASGVGSAAVQIAKDAGAVVIATASSAEKRDWVAGLGADAVLDHRPEQLPHEVQELTAGRGADVVLDAVGGATVGAALRAAARGGRVVALANVALEPSTIDTRDFYPRNVHIHGFQITELMEHGWDPRPDLGALLAGVAGKRFTVGIDSTFALADAPDAHRRLGSRAVRGKVIITGR